MATKIKKKSKRKAAIAGYGSDRGARNIKNEHATYSDTLKEWVKLSIKLQLLIIEILQFINFLEANVWFDHSEQELHKNASGFDSNITWKNFASFALADANASIKLSAN